jgi:hypothetical protein
MKLHTEGGLKVDFWVHFIYRTEFVVDYFHSLSFAQ